MNVPFDCVRKCIVYSLFEKYARDLLEDAPTKNLDVIVIFGRKSNSTVQPTALGHGLQVSKRREDPFLVEKRILL